MAAMLVHVANLPLLWKRVLCFSEIVIKNTSLSEVDIAIQLKSGPLDTEYCVDFWEGSL